MYGSAATSRIPWVQSVVLVVAMVNVYEGAVVDVLSICASLMHGGMCG